MIDGGLGWHSL